MSEIKDTLFLNARSYNGWQDKAVSKEQVEELYGLTKMGPTGFNSCPARFVFCHSQESRDHLAECVMDGNKEKVRTAPLVAIVAMDLEFYEHFAKLWPHDSEVKSWYDTDEAAAEKTAAKNSTLQGAYLMMAARSVGLDCGPMGGFDANKVNETFLADTTYKVNFLCSIGYGDEKSLFPRGPRLEFEEACDLI